MREKVAELLYLMETARGTTSFRYWGALKEQEKKIYLKRTDRLLTLHHDGLRLAIVKEKAELSLTFNWSLIPTISKGVTIASQQDISEILRLECESLLEAGWVQEVKE